MKLRIITVPELWFLVLFNVFEFNEFEPRLKSSKNQFPLSSGLNLETLNTILSETKDI